MRDLHKPGRSAVRTTNAMAVTSQPEASLAAIDMLRAGGNAVDACVAAAAVQAVTEPGSTGIGGDCFCLYQPAGAKAPIALNGSGKAPAGLSADLLTDRGDRELDPNGPHVVTVPGAIDAWETLLADHGKLGLADALQRAIDLAENGFVVHCRAARDWAGARDKLARDEGSVQHYLTGGKAPREGDVARQPALAATMRKIAREGRKGFYEGEVADDIIAALRAKGGMHAAADFDAQRSAYVTPVSTDYRGYRVYECPPNGVGVIALLMMNMMETADPFEDPMSIDRLHRLVEINRLAYRDRNAFVADPDFADVPVDRLLSKDYAAELADFISPDRAIGNLPPAGMPAHADTVYLSVVDAEGNVCSFINSLFKGFGSGITAPKSGVLLHNRGFGFTLEDNHPNRLEGGKRPMHTIIPAVVTKDDKPVMPFGVMGGHFQPVGQSWVLSNIVDHGMDVQEAIDFPRLFAYEGKVELEHGIPQEKARALAGKGHVVNYVDGPHGGGQGIWIDHEKGTLTGGSDPRKDGMAIGY